MWHSVLNNLIDSTQCIKAHYEHSQQMKGAINNRVRSLTEYAEQSRRPLDHFEVTKSRSVSYTQFIIIITKLSTHYKHKPSLKGATFSLFVTTSSLLHEQELIH